MRPGVHNTFIHPDNNKQFLSNLAELGGQAAGARTREMVMNIVATIPLRINFSSYFINIYFIYLTIYITVAFLC